LCDDWHVAEGLVQESLAKAALRWPRIEAMDNPDGYVRRVLVNQPLRRWRRRSTSERTLGRVPDVAVNDGSSQRAAHAELHAALASLPPRQRAAIVLRYYEDLSVAETAAVLGCSVGTVKSQTSRALKALASSMNIQEISC
jgi:RNA polymerase sigma-70 factor (sigma-E family)